MILDHASKLAEPPLGQLVQDHPFVRDQAVQHVVERADLVGGHHQQPAFTHRIELADLSSVEQRQVELVGVHRLPGIGGRRVRRRRGAR